jgi:hypothetical protein
MAPHPLPLSMRSGRTGRPDRRWPTRPLGCLGRQNGRRWRIGLHRQISDSARRSAALLSANSGAPAALASNPVAESIRSPDCSSTSTVRGRRPRPARPLRKAGLRRRGQIRTLAIAHRHTSATVPPDDCFRGAGGAQRASASATTRSHRRWRPFGAPVEFLALRPSQPEPRGLLPGRALHSARRDRGRGCLAACAGDGDRSCSRSRASPPPTYTSQGALMRP